MAGQKAAPKVILAAAIVDVPSQLVSICVTALPGTDRNVAPMRNGKSVSGLKKIFAAWEKFVRRRHLAGRDQWPLSLKINLDSFVARPLYSFGGHQSTLAHRRRAWTISSWFSCNATTVARPHGVRPMMRVPSWLQAKCSAIVEFAG
jgi:hypothetical protein